METRAQFPQAPLARGMYESFYLRTFAPDQPLGLWIRYTVHKAPGHAPRGSVWCVAFDARRGRPFMHKLTSDLLTVPADGWIAIDEDSSFGPGHARGRCGEASWSLDVSASGPELHHLSPELLYRMPLPRTKLTSPAPVARFNGVFELPGVGQLELRDWPGMVGHNWGAEHAERWIWLHGTDFAEQPDAWIDVGLGRLLLGSRLTPWAASGAICVGGERYGLGGLLARGVGVHESPEGCTVVIPGRKGVAVRAHVSVPTDSAAGWRYADPDGGEHDVVNCSVAALELSVSGASGGRPEIALTSAHGGAYELGMRERDHGVPIAPFADG